MDDPRYHDAILCVFLGAAIGAALFAWAVWSPGLGAAVGGMAALVAGAVMIAAGDEGKRG